MPFDPVIILDKCVMQTLSREESIVLHNCYTVNSVPLLHREIRGDLKKPSKRSTPQDEVKIIAQKHILRNSVVNVHYLRLLRGSLLDEVFPLDGRAIVPGNWVRAVNGECGVIYEETTEEQDLSRWRRGEFSLFDTLMAETWRQSTKSFDMETYKRDLVQSFSNSKPPVAIKDIRRLLFFLDEALKSESSQHRYLEFLLWVFAIHFPETVRLRWGREGRPLLRDFAPYAFHYFRVALFFHLALIYDLIGTRPTNRVDVEYLFYLPFCTVFSSDDKFLKQLCPLFLRKDQRFLDTQTLKRELSETVSKPLSAPKYGEGWSDLPGGKAEESPRV